MSPEHTNSAPPEPSALPAAPVREYFLSRLLRWTVYLEGDSKPVGRLSDIGVHSETGPYPLAVCLEVKPRRGGMIIVPWSDVLEFGPQSVLARRPEGPSPAADIWLRRDVLDDQVVDLSGAKVVRVNDVHLLHAEGQLIVGHVAVGMRSILRRLGFERPVAALLRWLLDYGIKDKFVTWRAVELMSSGAASRQLKVSAAPLALEEMHPADLADIIEELGLREGHALLSRLPVGTAAETLEEMEPEFQRALISRHKPDTAADILDEMDAEEAAGVLRDLHDDDAQHIISRMDSEAAEDVRTLLAYEDESVGSLMTTECLEARPDERAAKVLQRVRSLAEGVAVLNYAYVLDEGRGLAGVVSLRELLCAPPDAVVSSLMTTHVVHVPPDARMKEVARLFGKYGFRALPVVDVGGEFLGAVRLRSVLDALSPFFGD